MNLVEKVSIIPQVKLLMEMMRLSNTEAYNHSFSVGEITEAMLEQISEYTEEEKKEIVTGALLHDVGKIFVPFNLTQLPHGLTLQEFNIVKVHASVSYEIVKSVFSKIVQDICLFHHERPNGTGYMGNYCLHEIPKEALLVQAADVYDALISKRSYKDGYASEDALKIMRSEAYQFMLDDYYVELLEKAVTVKEEVK